MQLSRKILSQLNGTVHSVPEPSIFQLSEKVLQFGTGVLLRGLPDFYIDKANKKGIFNGRIVMVKSTDSGDSDAYSSQQCMYTQCVKGIQHQEVIEEFIINASISRVLSARTSWKQVLACASNPDLQIIISNTTEVGIVLMEDDDVNGDPPSSFPGKLLAFLYERYKIFKGDINKGFIILPTELVTENGSKLQSILMELAHLNKFEYAFFDWLENANQFCNTLVDRIVPGKLPPSQQRDLEQKLGYSDELMIMSEAYSLWAIEAADEGLNEKLGFAKADENIVVTNDIRKHRELKLRLLNGTHTFSCGLAHLAGFQTVLQGMQNETLSLYVQDLMIREIVPCIVSQDLSLQEANEFANKVIDRFRNPFIEHKWISITMQYTYKMKMRNIPLIMKHANHDLYVPSSIALGFAAFLLFMKCKPGENGKYYGQANDNVYEVQDDQANYFHKVWKEHQPLELVKNVLSNTSLWGVDLTTLPGFSSSVHYYLDSIMKHGAMEVLEEYITNKNKVQGHEA